MSKNILTSEKGFGIIQVLTALLIASVSIAGLYISAQYASYKSVANYHYRVALLKGLEKFEQIKLKNTYNKASVVIEGIFTGEFIMDDNEGDTVKGKIEYIRKKTHKDLQLGNNIYYDQVTLKITWKDGPNNRFGEIHNPKRELILREDYYYKSDTGIAQ
ncbi:MAG: hypothetical protein K8R49_09120 [Candidatus Cloacimonetes bacterium]|nr:hypothetical protein [Candidatus Cloacimonadota bacterium]